MARRLTLLLLVVLFITLAVSSAATAGSDPQAIYDDYASDGKLDNPYSTAELSNYLNDGRVHEYGDPSLTARLDEVALHLSARDVFPVSGFQIAMAVLVVVVLIVGGIMLRRLSRPRKPTEPPESAQPPESPDGP